MRTLITTVLFAGFIGLGASAQTAMIPGGAPQDVIFRGYENVVFVEDNESLKRKFKIEIEGGEFSVIQANDGTTNQGKYLISPGHGKNVVLIIKDNEGNEMNRYDYQISRIPDNEVLFATKDGSFSIDEPKMRIHNSVYAFFEHNSEIVSWKLEHNGSVIESGNGNTLSPAAMNAISHMEPGESFVVKAYVQDSQGITRIRSINTNR